MRGLSFFVSAGLDPAISLLQLRQETRQHRIACRDLRSLEIFIGLVRHRNAARAADDRRNAEPLLKQSGFRAEADLARAVAEREGLDEADDLAVGRRVERRIG